MGGAAEAQYRRTVAGLEAADAAGELVHGGYANVKGAAEPKYTEVHLQAAAAAAPSPAGSAKL